MLRKIFAGAVICASFVGPTQAAKMWTIEMHGILAQGSARWLDSNPDFFTDLSGMAFTQTITASIDPTDWSTGSAAAADYSYLRFVGDGPAFSIKLTVSGRTDTYTAVSTFNGQQKVDTVAGGGTRLISQQTGMMADGGYILMSALVTNAPADWLKPLSNGEPYVTYDHMSFFNGIVYFSRYSDSNERISLSGNLDRVTVSIMSAVPEPETYAMLLAGLGLVGAVARRRQKHA